MTFFRFSEFELDLNAAKHRYKLTKRYVFRDWKNAKNCCHGQNYANVLSFLIRSEKISRIVELNTTKLVYITKTQVKYKITPIFCLKLLLKAPSISLTFLDY